MGKLKKLLFLLILSGIIFTGCSSSQDQMDSVSAEAEKRNAEIETLKSQLDAKDATLTQLKSEVSNVTKENETLKNYSETVATSNIEGADELFPPNAKPGECYARVLIPARYETKTEDVLAKEESSRLEILPAKFAWGTEKVLVKEVSTKVIEVPATYKWEIEKILVKPTSSKLVKVPAKYKWTEEKLLVKPAHTVWKKGSGLIEKLDNSTGELMCLVEVPAEYKTVKTKVLVSAETTQTVEIPAEYETVKVKKVASAATTRTIEIPAEYKTVKVRKETNPASTKKTVIPAEYQKVTKRIKVSEERMEWRSVLCETNSSGAMVTQIQRALLKAGHNPGPIDGVIGSETKAAIVSFQKAKGLAIGGITQQTLKKLGM